jgi:predicted ATP-grasp superfamily ATP-dependent carboligase
LDYVHRHRTDVTLALGDVSAGIIAGHKPELIRRTAVTIPDWEVYEQAADKAKTMAFCMKNDIPCPRTFFLDQDDSEGVIDRLPFPLMVKPRRGIGAVGLHRIDTPQDLRRHYPRLRQQYGELIVQEFIPLEDGMQYQAEAFLDQHSRMKVCMVISKPRFFPVTGGTSTANMTIARPDIQQTVQRLLEGLRWSGAADVDLILDPRDGKPKVLEINPRVTAGIKIGFAAGIDFADLHLRLATGRPIPQTDSYKLGVYSRNLCMDILWYCFSDRRSRRSTPLPFFRFFGRDVCYQTFSADDPMPELGFILGMLRQYAKTETRRAKLGTDLE